MARQHRVVDHIVEYLAEVGVAHIFGVDGANIEDLYDAAYHHPGVTAVVAKHEFSAATMADGYSRSGAGLGVVAATSGGGALNLVPGLAESLASRVPVLALVGQPPVVMDGRGSFQDISGRNGSLDSEALFATVSVRCQRIRSPADIAVALPRAVAAARTGGPAVLLLPKDVQQAGVFHGDGQDLDGGDLDDGLGDGRRGGGVASGRVGDLHPIVRAFRHAEGMVTVIAGEQVARDDARIELEALAALLDAPVVCVPDAKDVGASCSSSAQMITGVVGHPVVADLLAASAVCLVVGTRIPAVARSGIEAVLDAARTVSIGSAPPYLPCTHVHSDDLRVSLAALAYRLRGWTPAVRVADRLPRGELSPPRHRGPGVRYRDAMAVLDTVVPAGTDIVVDAGNTGASALHYLPVRREGRFIVALGMGGMGYSFGAGIGMAFGRARRTVVVAGDGAFFMHGMEIHTALQYRLPVTFVLFNNNAHAMCVTREQLFYDDLYSYNRFRLSALGAGLGAMFPGLPAADVTETGELPAALTSALNTDGPSVVSIECSADEIPPFAPFLTAAKEDGHVTARA